MGDGPCCKVARRLGPKKLAKLDAELRDPAHRSFAKLGESYDVPRSSIEAHKKVCLRLGVPKPHLDPSTVPAPEPVPVRVLDVQKTVQESSRKPVDVQNPADSRAHVSAITATSRAERVAWIVQEILGRRPENLFHRAAEVPRLAALWGLGETTVEEYVRAAEDVITVNAGDVRSAKVQCALDTRAIRDRAIELDDLQSANAAQKELNRVLGAVDDGKKVVVNVVQHPAFMAMVDVALDALRPWPEARAAVVNAWMRAAKELEQPAPQIVIGTGEEIPE